MQEKNEASGTPVTIRYLQRAIQTVPRLVGNPTIPGAGLKASDELLAGDVGAGNEGAA